MCTYAVLVHLRCLCIPLVVRFYLWYYVNMCSTSTHWCFCIGVFCLWSYMYICSAGTWCSFFFRSFPVSCKLMLPLISFISHSILIIDIWLNLSLIIFVTFCINVCFYFHFNVFMCAFVLVLCLPVSICICILRPHCVPVFSCRVMLRVCVWPHTHSLFPDAWMLKTNDNTLVTWPKRRFPFVLLSDGFHGHSPLIGPHTDSGRSSSLLNFISENVLIKIDLLFMPK